jgi:hypothetical protein
MLAVGLLGSQVGLIVASGNGCRKNRGQGQSNHNGCPSL